MDTPTLVSRILEAGCASTAKNPAGSVRTCLADELHKTSPRLVKVDHAYGLPNWIEIKVPSEHK